MTKHQHNIQAAFNMADSVDIKEGKLAYSRYNLMLEKIARHYDVGFVQTVAAFVVLSPQNDYIGNLRSLVTLLVARRDGIDPKKCSISTFNACKTRAWAYLTGAKDFLIETQGQKTISFYWNIIKPDNNKYVTVDGHMYSIYVGRRLTMKQAARINYPSGYNNVADEFKKAARRNKLKPNQLQAILWFAWKRRHNVLAQHQLSFLKKDVWGLLIEPEEITPYKILR